MHTDYSLSTCHYVEDKTTSVHKRDHHQHAPQNRLQTFLQSMLLLAGAGHTSQKSLEGGFKL